MKRKKFSVEQIVSILKQANLGLPVADLIRQVGISEQTFYRWKRQYAGLESDQVREFKQLAEENGRLKKLVAELSLDKAVLQGCWGKNILRPALMRQVVAYLIASHGYSQRRACRLTRQGRSTQRRISRRDPRTELRQRMHEIAETRVRYGYRRSTCCCVARLERRSGCVGCIANKACNCEQIAQAAGQEAACRPLAGARRQPGLGMDFVHDQLFDGRKIRALTVVDTFTRLAPAIEGGRAGAAVMLSQHSMRLSKSAIQARSVCYTTTS